MTDNVDPAVAAALTFVETHGVVLASAKGPAPRLVDVIAAKPIAGNWWVHPKAHEIYRVLSEVGESDHVLVCRLVDGKITLVHRRLWPALVRVADRFAPGQICQVREEHTPSGRHVTREVPFPEWVPAAVMREATSIAEDDAVASFRPFINL